MLSIACQDGNHPACMRAGCDCRICDHATRARHPADPPDVPAETSTAPPAAPPPPVALPVPTEPNAVPKPRRERRPHLVLPVTELARLYTVEGWRLRQIGRLYGVRAQTIKRHLVRAGVPIRAQGDCSKHLPDAEIAARYQAGERTQVLADEFGVSPDAIRAHVRKAGGLIRPSGSPSTRLESNQRTGGTTV